jgi:hypothetical protein
MENALFRPYFGDQVSQGPLNNCLHPCWRSNQKEGCICRMGKTVSDKNKKQKSKQKKKKVAEVYTIYQKKRQR